VKIYQTKSKGFTLIELIVVIVILGIMAAIAGPKFVNLQTDARISVMKGVEGAVRSAATLAYSKSLIEGEEASASAGTTATQVVMGNQIVETDFGYPAGTAAGIGVALDLSSDVTVTHNGSGVSTFANTKKTACLVTYTEATAAGDAPDIDVTAVTATNC